MFRRNSVTLHSVIKLIKYNSFKEHNYIKDKAIPVGTADGGTVVKVLRYKSEGRWFESRWCHGNLSIDILLPIALWPWGRLSLYQN
jgi:hypothetical protein